MDTSKAEVRLTHDSTSTEKVSVKLRVIYQRDSRRYALPIKEGVFLSKADFDKLTKCHMGHYGKSAERIQRIYDTISPHLEHARFVIEHLTPFTFASFKEEFYRPPQAEESGDRNDLLAALWQKAEVMRQQGREGNAGGYEMAGKSLTRFLLSLSKQQRLGMGLPPLSSRSTKLPVTLSYVYVTPEFLAAYEAWMLAYGKSAKSPTGKPGPASSTTVGIYLRHVRAVFNDALEEQLIVREQYPFGKKKYLIPAGRNKKKALSRAEIELLKTYQPEDPSSFEQRSFDLFFFSYYGNGMNLTDIANLRWRNLDLKAGSFSFIREKTHRTKKENQEPIVGKLRPETRAIIERWSQGPRLPEGYVFPFLEVGLTAKRGRDIIQQLVKVTNQYMRRIAGQLGIESDITTYWARHSFATALLRSEAPLGFISQALGHSDLKTTQAYLGSFDNEQTSRYLDAL